MPKLSYATNAKKSRGKRRPFTKPIRSNEYYEFHDGAVVKYEWQSFPGKQFKRKIQSPFHASYRSVAESA